MDFFRNLAFWIERMTKSVGRCVYWLTLVMVLIGAFNALARSASKGIGINLSSNAFIELQWYLFSAVFLLGAAYTLAHGDHVRVDVFYGRASVRVKAWIDLVGTLVFLMPFCILMIRISWPTVVNSWHLLEQSPDPGGLPRYPIKTLIPIAFLLLILQGIAEIIKQMDILFGAGPPGVETWTAGGSDAR